MAHPLDFLTPQPEKWHTWKTALGEFPILLRYPDDAEVKAALTRYIKPDRLTGGTVDAAEQAKWIASLIRDWKITAQDGAGVPCTPDNALYLVQKNRDLKGWIETLCMSADAFRGEARGAAGSSTTGDRSTAPPASSRKASEAATTAASA